MASSEPRLPYGDGQSEVYAAPVATPLEDGPSPGQGSPEQGSPSQHSLSQSNPAASKDLPMQGDSTSASPHLSTGVQQALPNSIISTSQPVQKHKRITDEQERLPALVSFSDLLLEAPAWLFSAAIHMAAVIILGLLFIVPERPLELILSLDQSDGFEELSGSEFDVALDLAEESLETTLEPTDLASLEDPVLVEPTEILPLEVESTQVASPIRLALTGRSEGMQQKLVDAYGGSGATQQAVAEALRWLYRNQGRQGMWSLRGKYRDGAKTENEEAATGLALLAFQGAGYTPDGDPQHDFTRATSRAWSTLLRRQKDDGHFYNSSAGRANGQLYTQAICTIAICELYGMTENSRYREPAQRAIDYCTRIQSSEGGWRYYPGSGSDLSVTGWFVMAMQSARMAGLDVPTTTLDQIRKFLDSVSHDSGSFYSYLPRNGPTASMTAEGLLCRQYLGWSQTDSRLRTGANYLIRNLPTWDRDRDVYYWYYATQVCHHMEGKHWRTWNKAMKEVLPANQVKEGNERGSWSPKGDEWGSEAGRLYVTCLSTFMLEVYYRHLPIYQSELLGAAPK